MNSRRPAITVAGTVRRPCPSSTSTDIDICSHARYRPLPSQLIPWEVQHGQAISVSPGYVVAVTLPGGQGFRCGAEVLPGGVRLREEAGDPRTGRQDDARRDGLSRDGDHVQSRVAEVPGAGPDHEWRGLTYRALPLLRRCGRTVPSRNSGRCQGAQAARGHVLRRPRLRTERPRWLFLVVRDQRRRL